MVSIADQVSIGCVSKQSKYRPLQQIPCDFMQSTLNLKESDQFFRSKCPFDCLRIESDAVCILPIRMCTCVTVLCALSRSFGDFFKPYRICRRTIIFTKTIVVYTNCIYESDSVQTDVSCDTSSSPLISVPRALGHIKSHLMV